MTDVTAESVIVNSLLKKMATTDEIEAALSKSFDSLITSFPDMKDKQVDAAIGALSGNDVFHSPTYGLRKNYNNRRTSARFRHSTLRRRETLHRPVYMSIDIADDGPSKKTKTYGVNCRPFRICSRGSNSYRCYSSR